MIVGFTGRKRHGKDTAAAALVVNGHTRLSFAAPMKLMIRELLRYQGVDEETIERMLEGDLKEAPTKYLGGRSPRYALQTLGTEWGRDLMATDFWADILLNTSDMFEEVVVSDVRFPNEVAKLKEAGGKVIRVIRPGVANNDNHPSETQIDTLPVDHEITNDGTVVDLHKRVREILDVQ